MPDNNPDSPAPFPMDLSGLRDVPAGDVAPLLDRAVEASEEGAISALTALLRNRVLRLLHQGSRQEILDEAMMVNRFLAVEAGANLRRHQPEAYGRWSSLGELLSAAARSTGRTAIPALLLGTQGHGPKILQLLAAEGSQLRRADLRRRLDLNEAHLSHLLRDLEEADLIVRYRPKGSKEVFVELGPAGRELTAQPAASDTSSRVLIPAKSNVLPFVQRLADKPEDGEYHFQSLLDRQGGRPARALFTPEVKQAAGG